MYEEINRFLSHPDQKIQRRFTRLFETEQWQSINLPGDREQQVYDLYRTQLQTVEGNTKYVCMFRIKNLNNATDYFLVFGTQKLENLEKMKDVFWEIDPYNDHTFATTANHYQLPLLQPEPDYALLDLQLRFHFRGKTVYTSELDEYILANTPFRREYREQVLKYMEQTSHISILSSHHSHDLKSLTEGVYIRFPQAERRNLVVSDFIEQQNLPTQAILVPLRERTQPIYQFRFINITDTITSNNEELEKRVFRWFGESQLTAKTIDNDQQTPIIIDR